MREHRCLSVFLVGWTGLLKITLKFICSSKQGAGGSLYYSIKKGQGDHSRSIVVVRILFCTLHGCFNPLRWHAISNQPNRYRCSQSTGHEMQSLLCGRHYHCIPVTLVKHESQSFFSKALVKPQNEIKVLWASKDSLSDSHLPSLLEGNIDSWS